jgi:ketosteroid isomerase-like protein
MIRYLLRLTGVAAILVGNACGAPPERAEGPLRPDTSRIVREIEAAVWAFHAADTARDAEAVIRLLWPDFTILVDGARQDYRQVASGSRAFMSSLELFHTSWTDLQIIPLGVDAAIASFQFRDSIITHAGDLIRSRGPTTFLWERRTGEWRLRFADADHYPIDQ